MRKIIKLIFTISIVTVMVGVFVGCSEDQRKMISSDPIAQANCEAIIHALDHDDKEELKALFCNNIKATKELDAQIQAAMDFYEGKTVSYDTSTSSGGASFGYGKIKWKDISPSIDDIVTDENKKYHIVFYAYVVNAGNRDNEGISKISIYAEDGEECIVGAATAF